NGNQHHPTIDEQYPCTIIWFFYCHSILYHGCSSSFFTLIFTGGVSGIKIPSGSIFFSALDSSFISINSERLSTYSVRYSLTSSVRSRRLVVFCSKKCVFAININTQNTT